MEISASKRQALEKEMFELERRLQDIRSTLRFTPNQPTGSEQDISKGIINGSTTEAILEDTKIRQHNALNTQIPHTTSLHALLLLSDSALPLGSFAFSNGLESYLAHYRIRSSRLEPTVKNQKSAPVSSVFHSFLHLSILNAASTTLPFLFATFRNPAGLEGYDDEFDATLSCTVARRASVAQGRALVGVWEKSFAPAMSNSYSPPSSSSPMPSTDSATSSQCTPSAEAAAAVPALKALMVRLRSTPATRDENVVPTTHAHFAPVFGVVAAGLGIIEHEAAYVFLLSHAKAVLSAGVRAGVLGPFASQAVLAEQPIFMAKREGKRNDRDGREGLVGLRELIEECIVRERGTPVEEAGIAVPAIDLWQGRHELLYSRIFNS